MKQYLEVGKIVTTVGLKGEVKIMPWCDSPELLCELKTLYTFQKPTDSYIPIELEGGRVLKNMAVIKIKGIDTVERAQRLRSKILYMDRNDVELEEGCYFIQDLIGLNALDADSGRSYGVICDVTETGANDVYHIKAEDGRLLYCPAIAKVVIETNIADGFMKIRPLRGLFDDED